MKKIWKGDNNRPSEEVELCVVNKEVEISKTLAKYCTKEFEILIGEKLQSIAKLSL